LEERGDVFFTSPLSSKAKCILRLPHLLENEENVMHSVNQRGKNGFAYAVGVSLI
jgi:hypothetical protein